jgi:hypothetical protein
MTDRLSARGRNEAVVAWAPSGGTTSQREGHVTAPGHPERGPLQARHRDQRRVCRCCSMRQASEVVGTTAGLFRFSVSPPQIQLGILPRLFLRPGGE